MFSILLTPGYPWGLILGGVALVLIGGGGMLYMVLRGGQPKPPKAKGWPISLLNYVDPPKPPQR
jgi:hypothetical protein